ncbi:MAG: permease-like cell division protein FtsX [bacterium]
MIGIVVFIYQSSYLLTRQTKENISLSIILDDSIQTEDLTRIQKFIDNVPYTKESIYISKDSALRENIAALGEDPSQFLGYNPLNASIEVYLKSEYADIDSIASLIIPKFQIFNGVVDITYQKDMIQLLNQNINKISILFSAIILVLLFISIVLINNTIKLSIYSKRFIINTMQLVGAKNSFIRVPFVKRSMINSLIASIIALAMLGGVIYYMQTEIGETINLYSIEILAPIVVIVFALGFIINYLATVAAVNRYLRLKTDQLYYI